ncbi:MAG: type IV pilus secretin PilQ, partial [Thermodesulfobacteriota bacterium]
VPPEPEPEVEAAPAPEPAAVPEPAMPAEVAVVPEALSVEGEVLNVKSVNFRKVNGNGGMLSITTSGKPAYKVTESNEGLTVTLEISQAAIPDELKMTLDASELNTAVSSISSFQPVEEDKNVRILVKLNEKTAYTVKESNGTINVAFAASKAAAHAAAETPAKAKVSAPKAEIPMAKPLADERLQPKKYKGRKIDIDMIDAQVTDILKIIAEEMDKNIVASEEDVKGRITLRLKKIPADQAFDLILKMKGLDKIEEGNVIRVSSRDKIRKEKDEEVAARKKEEKEEDLTTEYISINYDKASTLKDQVKSVLSDRGVPTVHETTNTLIIRDTKAGIAAAKDYIKRVDKPTPQVLIEARIVYATTEFTRDLGIQWGVDTQFPDSAKTSKVHTSIFGSAGSSVTGPSSFGDSGVSNYAVNLPAANTLGALGFVIGKTGANPMLLDLRLSAGEHQGQLKIISRPRVVTMDNVKAVISQGKEISSPPTGTATEPTKVEATLSLEVTPQITPDGSVIMNIIAKDETFETTTVPALKSKKEVNTKVLVKDGETTVIGGIIISNTSKGEDGIPFLKDIPILGWLFKNKSVSDSQNELLIFITPTIIKTEDSTAG